MALELSGLQQAWLRELGVHRQILDIYGRRSEPTDAPQSLSPQADQHQPPSRDPSPIQRPVRDSADLQRPSIVAPKAPAPSIGPAPRETPPTATPDSAQQPARAALPADMAALEVAVQSCQACILHEGRGRPVFGAGADTPEWMIIGEAPGGQDDRKGRPFQGKAGVLLHAMLAAAGVPDDTVYFTNVVKCRPLGNRVPTEEEIAACLPVLQRQIVALAPKRILALGMLAAQALLQSKEELDDLRGKVHVYHPSDGATIPLVVTYHPAALLLRPQHKLDAWRDLNLALGAANPTH